MMLLLIVVQISFWYWFVDFFNKHAYYDKWGCHDKAYINRFIQILGYLCNLLPGVILVEFVILAIIIPTEFVFPKFKKSITDTNWYKWLFNNPNDGKDN